MKRTVLAALLWTCVTTSATAEFLTYSQWEREPQGSQGSYVVGLFDALVGFGTTNEDKIVGVHYTSCIVRAQMNSRQLADNVRQFASARPEYHGGSVLAPFIGYLIALCGKPPV